MKLLKESLLRFALNKRVIFVKNECIKDRICKQAEMDSKDNCTNNIVYLNNISLHYNMKSSVLFCICF